MRNNCFYTGNHPYFIQNNLLELPLRGVEAIYYDPDTDTNSIVTSYNGILRYDKRVKRITITLFGEIEVEGGEIRVGKPYLINTNPMWYGKVRDFDPETVSYDIVETNFYPTTGYTPGVPLEFIKQLTRRY